jgi:alkylation response protein AidB-like acyl-CoA dehydrogenase
VNLLPTPEQIQILDAARNFLSAEAPVERLRPQHGQIGSRDAHLWPDLGELGFFALGLAEADGGVGLGAAEEALLYREFGRHLMSPGVLGLTLGARLAAHRGDAALLEAIVSGAARVALANPRGLAEIGPVASGAFHLLEPHDAAWAIVWTSAGAGLFQTGDFTETADVLCMDSHLILERARLQDIEAVVWAPAEKDPIFDRAQLLIAAYAVGLAEACRDAAVAYAKVREQFGKPIGSFQAIKHKCADMAILAEAAWAQTAFAAVTVSMGRADMGFHTKAAKLLAADAALRNAAHNIQVHGAFGFTAEADAHLYLKRAHVMDQLGGDLRAQRAAVLREPPPL